MTSDATASHSATIAGPAFASPANAVEAIGEPVFAHQRPAPDSGRGHLTWIVLCGLVPLLGALLEVHNGQRVAPRFAPRFELPELCTARRLGVPCPGCGLTRSVVHLMHGDVHASLERHRFGWLIFGLIVVQIPLRLWLWRTGRDRLVRSPRLEAWLLGGAVGLLAANWVWNVVSA